jgi:hypothetical protein
MDKETKFLNAARRVLDEAEKNLDAATVARLRAARRQALDQGRRPRARPAWLFPVGGLVTAGVALAVAALLWFGAPNPAAVPNLGDLDLLTAHESPDFFADLDFYDWLDRNADAG